MQLQAEGSFNSMKVRLKHFVQLESWFLDQFQFHEGPIKTADLSKMYIQSLFQFHEGPIKTRHALFCTKIRLNVFQFHEGPIKTMVSAMLSALLSSFNSMKVRLKRVCLSISRSRNVIVSIP